MGSVQSIDRMFNILELIADSDEGIGISELSSATKLHKSTVHRLVTSLIENGYVDQLDNSKYTVTYKLYEIGSKVLSKVNLTDASREIIDRLANEIKEVVHLVVRNGNEIIYIDKKNPGSNSSIMGSRIGSSAPLYCTSVGKSMLFNSSDQELKEVWKESVIEKKTENTIVDFNSFKEEIYVSKSRGYAIDDEENEVGIRCVGAPIFDYGNNIVAAISLSGPVSRVSKDNIEKYYKPLTKAAYQISKNMGYVLKK